MAAAGALNQLPRHGPCVNSQRPWPEVPPPLPRRKGRPGRLPGAESAHLIENGCAGGKYCGIISILRSLVAAGTRPLLSPAASPALPGLLRADVPLPGVPQRAVAGDRSRRGAPPKFLKTVQTIRTVSAAAGAHRRAAACSWPAAGPRARGSSAPAACITAGAA